MKGNIMMFNVGTIVDVCAWIMLSRSGKIWAAVVMCMVLIEIVVGEVHRCNIAQVRTFVKPSVSRVCVMIECSGGR